MKPWHSCDFRSLTLERLFGMMDAEPDPHVNPWRPTSGRTLFVAPVFLKAVSHLAHLHSPYNILTGLCLAHFGVA